MLLQGLERQPEFADFHFYLGNLHLGEQALESAVTSYRKALALGADYAALHAHLGGVLRQTNSLLAAEAHLKRALELEPGNAQAHHDQGVVYQLHGLPELAMAQQHAAVAVAPHFLSAHNCLLFNACFAGNCSPQHYLALARQFGSQVSLDVQPFVHPPASDRDGLLRPLRVGWVSADLRHHAVASFLEGVAAHLSSEGVEQVAFSNTPTHDAVTQRLRHLMAEWHEIGELSDAQAAALVHERQIDVLVDLAGHTAGNRLPIFAWRAAPVQVSWLGYFASTGMAEIDYLLSDTRYPPLRHWKRIFASVSGGSQTDGSA